MFVGTAAELAELMSDWSSSGLSGFRLRPAAIPHDLDEITNDVVPRLQQMGLFRPGHESTTLRDRLRLSRPANRYAGL